MGIPFRFLPNLERKASTISLPGMFLVSPGWSSAPPSISSKSGFRHPPPHQFDQQITSRESYPHLLLIETNIQATTLFAGLLPPLLGLGFLNAILFTSYKATAQSILQVTDRFPLSAAWSAGAVAGMACWIVSAPTELYDLNYLLETDVQGQMSCSATTPEPSPLEFSHYAGYLPSSWIAGIILWR